MKIYDLSRDTYYKNYDVNANTDSTKSRSHGTIDSNKNTVKSSTFRLQTDLLNDEKEKQ